MPEAPLIASRYRVLRELGRGGMGVVYVVEHARTGDQVALKVLHGRAAQDPQAIERFKREARASARIKSDHVVKVLDADVAPELDNAPFLVMELLDGSDLEKHVEHHRRLTPDRVVQYLSQAGRALDKSHAAGIVHRDLKPENLFVHRREDGSTILKILDFGISKIVGGEATTDMAGAGMTSTGAIMGTPLYMAPEQARGRVSEIGPATDVWAMGLIALYLLTGEIYWRVNTVAELMVHILSEPLYPPTERWPWLPPGIDAWFARSCAREPAQRFPTVGQQIAALGAVLGQQAQNASSIPQPEASAPWNAVQAPAGATLTAAPMLGASTTAATETSSRPGTTRRSRASRIAALAAVIVAGAGTTGWLMQKRSPQPASGAGTAAAVTNAGAPAMVTGAPEPAQPAPPSAAPASSSPIAAAERTDADALLDAGGAAPFAPSGVGGHRPSPSRPTAGHGPALAATTPATPRPQPAATHAGPASTPTTFNPAAP